MTVLVMSRNEIDRMEILRDLAQKRLRVAEAAKLLRLCSRQVLRLAKAYRMRGPVALASRQRGRPSNRSYPAALRSQALARFGTQTLMKSLLRKTAPGSTAAAGKEVNSSTPSANTARDRVNTDNTPKSFWPGKIGKTRLDHTITDGSVTCVSVLTSLVRLPRKAPAFQPIIRYPQSLNSGRPRPATPAASRSLATAQ
jgi:Winged helix-turn helix